jgi:hypothetical protein
MIQHGAESLFGVTVTIQHINETQLYMKTLDGIFEFDKVKDHIRKGNEKPLNINTSSFCKMSGVDLNKPRSKRAKVTIKPDTHTVLPSFVTIVPKPTNALHNSHPYTAAAAIPPNWGIETHLTTDCSKLGGNSRIVQEILNCRASWNQEMVSELLRVGATPELHSVHKVIDRGKYREVQCTFVQPNGWMVTDIWVGLGLLKVVKKYAKKVSHIK